MAILYRYENGHVRAEYGVEVEADPAVFSPEAIEELRREGVRILGDPPSSGKTEANPENADPSQPKP